MTWNVMKDIYGIRVSPFQGLIVSCYSLKHRALPYVIDDAPLGLYDCV